jgi:hypothetical protein
MVLESSQSLANGGHSSPSQSVVGSFPRTFNNPMPRLTKLSILFSFITGIIVFLWGFSIRPTSLGLIIIGLVIAPGITLIMFWTDRSLRPFLVCFTESGILLKLQSKKEISIPWNQIDIFHPSSNSSAYQEDGNIRSKGSKKYYYNISGNILSELRRELYLRNLPQ